MGRDPSSPPLEGCPVGAGWLVPHKNQTHGQDHPVRLRLTPLQRRGMDLRPLQGGKGDLCCSPACGGMTRLLEMPYQEIAPCFSGARGDRGAGTGPPPVGGGGGAGNHVKDDGVVLSQGQSSLHRIPLTAQPPRLKGERNRPDRLGCRQRVVG